MSGGTGRRGRVGFVIHALEKRRLLAGLTFDGPVSTELPAGFVPDRILAAAYLGIDGSQNDLLVTGRDGGAVLVQCNADGTFSLLQQINTSAHVFALNQLPAGNSVVPALFTTAGLMTRQTDGSFALTSHLQIPADYVPGAFSVGGSFNNDGGALIDVIVERFKPNPQDPGHGDIILAGFRQKEEGGTLDYGPEVDTKVATDVPPPPAQPLYEVNLPNQNLDGLLVGNVVWFSNGDDTFHKGTTLDMTAAEAAAPRYAADFTSSIYQGPLNTLAVFPEPGSNSGYDSVQFFRNGQGLLDRSISVNVAPAGTTAGPVIFADLDKDGTTDLATAVVNGPDAPEVLVMPSGFGGYLPPVTIPVPGLVAVGGVDPVDSGLVCFAKAVQGDGSTRYSLVALPNRTKAETLIQLVLPTQTVFAGEPVKIPVLASGSNGQVYTTFNLYVDGAFIANATTARDGSAAFEVPGLAAGVHTLTVGLGDGSEVLTSPVTLSVGAAPPGGLLFASDLKVTAGSTMVPGDAGRMQLTLTGLGGVKATAGASIKLFASTTQSIDSNSVQLSAPTLARVNGAVGAKQAKQVSGAFTLPGTVSPGSYYLIAQVTSGAKQSTGIVSVALVDPTPVQVVWQFGTVGKRSNVKFVAHLKNGGAVTFSLTGQGYGTVVPGNGPLTLGEGNPNFDVTILESFWTSNLRITQTGSTQPNIMTLRVNDELGTVDVRGDTPHEITTGTTQPPPTGFTGVIVASVKRLMIGKIPGAAPAAGAPADTSTVATYFVPDLGELDADSIDNAALNLGVLSQKPVQMKIGTLGAGATIDSAVAISKLEVGTALAGSSVVAPEIDRLTTAGDFRASMTLGGAAGGAAVLGSVDIGGTLGGLPSGDALWAVNGNVGTIRVRGDVTRFELLAGAKVGPDGELTEPPAAYSGVVVQSVIVDDGISSSVFAAGLDPVDGILLNGNDKLITGGAFGEVLVGGAVSGDSRIIAETLPEFVVVGGKKTSTAGDARFSL